MSTPPVSLFQARAGSMYEDEDESLPYFGTPAAHP